jgi:arylsulfatase A-like enzyme
MSLLILLFAVLAASAKSPNIIIILDDDLGFGDLGCYGHPSINTPNLDRMADEGLRFTEYYAPHNYCTPSRGALLTGRLAVRTGLYSSSSFHVLYPTHNGGLPPNEITIARSLKTGGYATACIGKWHLGHLAQYLPTSHGFDYFFGLPYSNDMDAVSPKIRNKDSDGPNPDWHHFNVPLMRGTNIIERPANQEALTMRYTFEATKFIHDHRKQPFFLYLAHTFPHVPLFASDRFKGKSKRGLFGDAVEEMDWSVGEVLRVLRDEKLADNTFVFFTSDNGPWLNKKLNGGSAGLMRDGKGGTWDGGHHVPAIAWWPGKIKPGVTAELASGLDLFPTALALAGVAQPTDRIIDGLDMRPILFGGKSQRDTILFYANNELRAVRHNDYKAHYITQDGYSKELPVAHNPPLLMQIDQDPSEKFDQAKDHPEELKAIERIVSMHKVLLVPGKPQF